MKALPIIAASFFFFATLWLPAAPDSPAPSAPAVAAPFQIVFKSYDGDPRRDPPEKFSFQIDTIDLRQPSDFLKLGDPIPHTPFKLLKFTFKEARNEKLGDNVDVSEITIVNVKTGQSAVIVYNKITDVSGIMSPATTPATK